MKRIYEGYVEIRRDKENNINYKVIDYDENYVVNSYEVDKKLIEIFANKKIRLTIEEVE